MVCVHYCRHLFTLTFLLWAVSVTLNVHVISRDIFITVQLNRFSPSCQRLFQLLQSFDFVVFKINLSNVPR